MEERMTAGAAPPVDAGLEWARLGELVDAVAGLAPDRASADERADGETNLRGRPYDAGETAAAERAAEERARRLGWGSPVWARLGEREWARGCVIVLSWAAGHGWACWYSAGESPAPPRVPLAGPRSPEEVYSILLLAGALPREM
jgi:hypothetical protein